MLWEAQTCGKGRVFVCFLGIISGVFVSECLLEAGVWDLAVLLLLQQNLLVIAKFLPFFECASSIYTFCFVCKFSIKRIWCKIIRELARFFSVYGKSTSEYFGGKVYFVFVPGLCTFFDKPGWGWCFIHRLESLVCGEEETNYRSSFLACEPALPVLRERVILVETGR